MPRSATFSVTAAGAHSSAHNSREEKPKYLIGQLKIKDQTIENVYDLRHSDADFLVLAEAKYKETTGQKMQAKQKDALIKETVLSLEDHHTEADVQKVFDELAAKYGGHYITELSIHRDEGHFEDENGITYYPTKDILQKEDGWYIVPLAESITHAPDYRPKAEEFSEKVDIDRFKPIHNVHAHVKFSMFDLNTGKTGRMQHKDLNDRIRTAARVLKLSYNPEKKNDKRVTVADKKAQHKAVRNEKVRNFLEMGNTIDALTKENEALRIRAEIAEKRAETAELALKESKATIEAMKGEIDRLKANIDDLKAMRDEDKQKLITTGTATPADYQALKKAHDELKDEAKAQIDALKAEIKAAARRMNMNIPEAIPAESVLKTIESRYNGVRDERDALKEVVKKGTDTVAKPEPIKTDPTTKPPLAKTESGQDIRTTLQKLNDLKDDQSPKPKYTGPKLK